jgi:hypothetical protein
MLEAKTPNWAPVQRLDQTVTTKQTRPGGHQRMLIPLFLLWIAGSPSRRRCKRLRVARESLVTADRQVRTTPRSEPGSIRVRRTDHTEAADLTLLGRAAA